jgi:methionyl-tRNA formyltransferase
VLAAGHEVVRIITQPPRPAGRGGHLKPTPVSQTAAELGLQAVECPDINDPQAVADLAAARADVICVADFGQFIRKAARRSVAMGAFNLHGSLLPELRGAAPVNWAILRGYNKTGVTTFYLVDRMDAGAIYLQAETDISPAETAEELRNRLAEIGAGLVCRTLDLLAEVGALPREQDESAATLAPQLKKTDGRIDWDTDAVTVRNLIHGTWPWPGGQAVFQRRDGKAVPVTFARASVAQGQACGRGGEVDQEGCIATGRGRLAVVEIQPSGKRLMSWRDFVNGYRVTEGDSFVSLGA